MHIQTRLRKTASTTAFLASTLYHNPQDMLVTAFSLNKQTKEGNREPGHVRSSSILKQQPSPDPLMAEPKPSAAVPPCALLPQEFTFRDPTGSQPQSILPVD